jgi:hypothetical protein
MSFRIGLDNRLLEFCSRKNLEQLIQDAAKSLHGADPPFDRKAWSFCRSYTEGRPLFRSFPKPNLDSTASAEEGKYLVNVTEIPQIGLEYRPFTNSKGGNRVNVDTYDCA